MSARIKISQAGLAAGTAGQSRTDGLATGALVTLEDVSGTGSSTFHLLDVPWDDTTSVASLAVTGDPDIWTFSPQASRYGSYRIELRDDGIPVERRIFGVRTPANALLIPALNERASRHASLANAGADQIDLCEQNANDFPLSALNNRRYAGWWRSLVELYRIVEFGTGSIANNALALIKLVQASSAPSVIGAMSNGNFSEITQATLAASMRGLGMTVATGGKLQTRIRPRRLKMEERFLSGNATSGQIGQLGWNLLGSGTPALNRVDVATEGTLEKIDLVTSAASGDRSSLVLGETETRKVGTATNLVLLQCAWGGALTSRRWFFGFNSNFATEPSAAVSALGIYYDSAVSANYQIIARDASAGSPVNTGVAVPNDTAELITIEQLTTGSFKFYSGNTLLGTISSGVPTAAMNLGWRLETLTTATRTLKLGYFNWEANALASFDDDAFLEA
jgi:hypothetical protein